MKTAQQFFESKPRAIEHADYMDFAELYADYVCYYEKNDGVSLNVELNRKWNAKV